MSPIVDVQAVWNFATASAISAWGKFCLIAATIPPRSSICSK